MLRKLYDPSTLLLVLEKGEDVPKAESDRTLKNPDVAEPGESRVALAQRRCKSFLVPDLYNEFPVAENLLSTRSAILEATRSSLREPHISLLSQDSGVEAYCLSVIEELSKVKDVLVNVEQILQLSGGEVFRHSINVCTLSLIYSYYFDDARERAKRLAAGALLHEVGKTKFGPNRLTGEGIFLTDPEYGYSVWSFTILKEFRNLGVVPLYIVLQHQEWYNGKGFPSGLKGSEIIQPARLLAVLDYYDRSVSMISGSSNADEVIIEAVNKIMQNSGTRLDPKLVSNFLVLTRLLGKNSFVQISSGEVGVVVLEGPDPLKPVVRLVFDRSGCVHESFPEVNLALEKDLKVVRVLNLKKFLDDLKRSRDVR